MRVMVMPGRTAAVLALVLMLQVAACGGGGSSEPAASMASSGPAASAGDQDTPTSPAESGEAEPPPPAESGEAEPPPAGGEAAAVVTVDGRRLEFDMVEDPNAPAGASSRCDPDAFGDFLARDSNLSGGEVVENVSLLLREQARMDDGDHSHEFRVAWLDGGAARLFDIVPFEELGTYAPDADYVGEWTVEGSRVHGEVLLLELGQDQQPIGSSPVTATFDVQCPEG